MSYNPYPLQQGYNPSPQSHPLPPNPHNQGYPPAPASNYPPPNNYDRMSSGPPAPPPPVAYGGPPPPVPYGGPPAPYGRDDRGRGPSGPPSRYGGGGGDRREMSPGELYFYVSLSPYIYLPRATSTCDWTLSC